MRLGIAVKLPFIRGLGFGVLGFRVSYRNYHHDVDQSNLRKQE